MYSHKSFNLQVTFSFLKKKKLLFHRKSILKVIIINRTKGS